MSGKNKSNQDKMRASNMANKDHPDYCPAPKAWRGVGRDHVMQANKLGNLWKGRSNSTWEKGMVGGILAARCGFGSTNIPEELL